MATAACPPERGLNPRNRLLRNPDAAHREPQPRTLVLFAQDVVAQRQAIAPCADAVPTSLPKHVPGLLRRVDTRAYPALGAVADWVHICRCPPNDIRRSDGRAAPLVIISGGHHFTVDGYIASIEAAITKKIARLPWETDPGRRVLVAHDVPRRHFYEAWGKPWADWLSVAATRADAGRHFQELWLVIGGCVGSVVGELTAIRVGI